MSLTSCIKNANLDPDDAARVREIAKNYREDGLSADDAAMKAAQDLFDEGLEERADIEDQVAIAGGTAPTRTEAANAGVRARPDAKLQQAALEGEDALESEDQDVDAAFAPENTNSPALMGSRFSPRDYEGDEVNFSGPDDAWHKTVIRHLQDKFKVLKDLQNNIEVAGGVITEENNAYLWEELFHGKAENDIRIMRETYVEPLADILSKHGISQEQLDRYLYAAHAKERNDHIAEINPLMPDSGSGMSNAKAATILNEIRNSGQAAEYRQAAQIIYDMNQAQRDLIEGAGLEDYQGQTAGWQEQYQKYVPLKGWAEDTKDEGIPGKGKGYSVGGKETRHALGRGDENLAASPSSYAISDFTEKIIRARKNEVGNALLKLIQDNPNPSYWQAFSQDSPEIVRILKSITDPETEEEGMQVGNIARNMAMFQNDYLTTKKDGKTYYMKLDPKLMRAMKNLGPETNGALVRTVGSVIRLMSALNTSYSPEFIISNFSRDIQTAYVNLKAEESISGGKLEGESIENQVVKDIPTAMGAIFKSLRGKPAKKSDEWYKYFDEFREEGAKTGWFDMKDLDRQEKELKTLISMANGGFKGGAMKWMKSANSFIEHGNTAVENAVRLSAYVNARRVGATKMKAASLAKNMTVNFNRRGEAGTVMNTLYMFANASVQGVANFARTMGTTRDGKTITLKGANWKNLNNAQRTAVGIMAGAYFFSMLNRWAAGDDDDGENWYDKVPDYERERNLIIMKTLTGGEDDGTYWKIPLPYGYNAFYVIGAGMESVLNGGRSPAQMGKETTLAILGSFSPIGFQDSQSIHGLFLKNATPTIFRPVVDIGLNENFMGTTIFNENFPFGTQSPDSELGRRSAPKAYEASAKWLNKITGGSKYRSGAVDVNPDAMAYFVEYFGGAAYAFYGNKVPEAAIRAATQQEITPSRIPFLSRVAGKVMPYQDVSDFYDRRDEIDQYKAEHDSLRGPERGAFYTKHAAILQLDGLSTSTQRSLSAMRDRRDFVYDQDLTPAARDRALIEVEKRMKFYVDRFNKAYNEAQ